MEALQSVISLIITLGILVTIHEYGHYWVARQCGVKVLRFSVGFGRPLFKWYNKEGTEFAIAAIPLGGYVKMLDEREAPVPDALLDQAFTSKPVGQRIAIAAAGPLANFLFAIVAYWAMFLIGFNVVLPKVGNVIPDTPAAYSEIEPGVIIKSVDGQEAYSWREVVMTLVSRIGETASISVTAQDPDSSGTNYRYTLEIQDWMQDRDDSDLLKGIGLEPFRPPVEPKISLVQEGGAAQDAGMLAGDLVTGVDGRKVADWYGFVEVVQKSAGEQLVVDVQRDGSPNPVSLKIVPAEAGTESGAVVGKIGVGVEPYTYPEELISSVSFGPAAAFGKALGQTWSDVAMTFGAVKKMVVGLISLENLSGPITIARVANHSISTGIEEFLRFLALLSVSLGVLNLLPIPVLDGGHILFYLIEAVRGKALSEKSQVLGLKIGMSLVLMLMVVAFYNDIMRL